MARTPVGKNYEWSNSAWIFYGSDRGDLYEKDTDKLVYLNCTLKTAKEYVKELEA